jgi:hypothetical protein
MPSIGQTWVLASIGAVVEMGILSTLKRLLMGSTLKWAKELHSLAHEIPTPYFAVPVQGFLPSLRQYLHIHDSGCKHPPLQGFIQAKPCLPVFGFRNVAKSPEAADFVATVMRSQMTVCGHCNS